MKTINEGMLAAIEGLKSTVARRAHEFESGGSIPRDLIEDLRSIGVFRMFVPRSKGGLELDLPTGIEILTALGKIDASFGWISMIGAGAALVAPELPQVTYDRIYESGPDVIFAGSFLPGGVANKVRNGWLVNGRWPFASGCKHADWILGLCTMRENGATILGTASGTPLMRGFILPADDWKIEDTWHVMGLKGTGSHHISLENAPINDENLFVPAEERWLKGRPLYSYVPQFIPLLHAANNVGVAEGALEDLVALAASGHRPQRAATSMRDSELFKAELGSVYADFRACRAFLQEQTASHWQRAVAGTLGEKEFAVQGSQMTTWISQTCVRIVDACFSLAGSSALYEESPLQRRMRDLHGAAQHAALQRRNYVTGGDFLLERALMSRPN